MPVYRTTIKGRRKSILIKAESSAKARDALVECEPLTAEKMANALGNGEQIWVPGTDLPADEPEPAPKPTPESVKPATGPAGPSDPAPEKDAEKPKT